MTQTEKAERRAKAVDRFLAGTPAEEVAEEFGVTAQTVVKWLRAAGHNTRQPAVDHAEFWKQTAPEVFALRYTDGWSVGRIAEWLTDTKNHQTSRETVRKVLRGISHAEVTEDLRRAHPYPADEPVKELTAEDREWVFLAWHEDKASLSQIAAELGDGYDYTRVRRILEGAELGDLTGELRARFPAYRQRTGRHSRSTPTTKGLERAFKLYFAEGAPLHEVHSKTGITKSHFKALVEGREPHKAADRLRAEYGSQLRAGGGEGRWAAHKKEAMTG